MNEDKIAKNLLLEETCDTCYHYTGENTSEHLCWNCFYEPKKPEELKCSKWLKGLDDL